MFFSAFRHIFFVLFMPRFMFTQNFCRRCHRLVAVPRPRPRPIEVPNRHDFSSQDQPFVTYFLTGRFGLKARDGDVAKRNKWNSVVIIACRVLCLSFLFSFLSHFLALFFKSSTPLSSVLPLFCSQKNSSKKIINKRES